MVRLERDADGAAPAPGDDAGWALCFDLVEVPLIRGLPDQLEDLLTHPERSRRVIARLFPAAHDDPADEAEFRRLIGEDLIEGRRETLDHVRRSLGTARRTPSGVAIALSTFDADCWLRFVNDMRLVLATDLGVEEDLEEERLDADDEDAPRFALLDYLGYVELLLLRVVSSPPGAEGASDAD